MSNYGSLMLRGAVLYLLNPRYLRVRPMENKANKQKIGPAGWIAIVVLGVFLVVSVVYAVDAWDSLGAVSMSGAGWLFLVLGVVFTVAVGGGLMWLVFYSSRHDYDR